MAKKKKIIKPLLKRELKFENEDTCDYMLVTIEGYYVEEFTNKIRQALRVVGSHGYVNKWKIVEDERLPGSGVRAPSDKTRKRKK